MRSDDQTSPADLVSLIERNRQTLRQLERILGAVENRDAASGKAEAAPSTDNAQPTDSPPEN